MVHDQYIRQLLKKILFFRMGKKKRKPKQQRLPDKDVSKQESQESATNFSNPTSQGAHSDIPQSSVLQTKEASSQETLMKPMSDMKLSELPIQKDVQKYPEHSSGARPKTSAQPKREPKQQQLSAKDNLKTKAKNQPLNFQIQHLQMLTPIFDKVQFHRVVKYRNKISWRNK